MDKKKYLLIVFCGMDGSGKTTLAKKVVEFFKKQGLKFEFIHAHGYSISQNSFGLDEERVNRLKYLFRLLIPFAFLDNLFTYYFKYKPILRNKVLICDRYFYDKVARMMYYGICNKFIAKIYLRLLPSPDFAFFLDASSKDVYKRKGEHSEKNLSYYRKMYRFIAKYLNAPVIDTNQPVNVCYKEILNFLEKSISSLETKREI